MKEEWKDIKGYEGLYQISNLGNVKRIKFINNIVEKEKIKILKPINNTYLQVALSKEGKVKVKNIHRLVAETFIPNPDRLPQVNHKDENKHNNNVDNLEWCSRIYNMNYGSVKDKISKSHRKENIKKRKPIVQYDRNMHIIKEYSGICEAVKETNIDKSSIIKCCKNKQKTSGGYIWKYKVVKEKLK